MSPKYTLALILCSSGLLAMGKFGIFSRAPDVESIETADLSEILRQQQQAKTNTATPGTDTPVADFIVVDVRSAAEVNVSIIPGAITKAHYEANRLQYQDHTVIPYCTKGVRSGNYAKELAKSGVKVKNYKGSILKWVEAGLPVVTLDGQPTNRVHTYSNRYQIPAQYQQVTE